CSQNVERAGVADREANDAARIAVDAAIVIEHFHLWSRDLKGIGCCDFRAKAGCCQGYRPSCSPVRTSVRRSKLIPRYGNNWSFLRLPMLLYDRKHLMGRPMRYSKEHKQETHERIVKRAAVRLREKGAHGIGVADLMKEAGLTHGGFYAHFDSREALVIEAFAYAMDRSVEHWRKIAAETPADKRLSMIVDSYVSTVHRDDPGRGCAVPTLGAEIARESAKTR